MKTGKPIIIGCDHAAYELKEKIKVYLTDKGYRLEDAGTKSQASVNYVDFGKKVARAVSIGQYSKGILLCGTGLGMSMVANRFVNVRAALCSDVFGAKMSRLHNDANILVLGGRVLGDILAFEIIQTWLDTMFEGGRHLERIQTIDN
ncbi:MAG: ribose 5-phosphate isomerase B [Desulfobacula sp.]|jgi:ribose 5-phosphate isomerase B|uniref:ribose 5-phosphate isomerase B n=1 Tax=Desulfobacula sp. TaxID=2593537 RepID=UPI001DC48F93|nr:ribose 5-phosphate isomerase B [Desulfobacula sp.]MBT3485244.1 ribose 5-phosphate isomerase B [Desulfobacula sp.]MBT3804749.1 ribose 5-phosphate isomerase B [Desulfobacula sp.]MBT4025227.1 ribose 5-phosphate isomerase B [Desulfobacula sp.]MBT4200683.1 ribose 5-phosphate isomerase B [Desulfobacula sp.]